MKVNIMKELELKNKEWEMNNINIKITGEYFDFIIIFTLCLVIFYLWKYRFEISEKFKESSVFFYNEIEKRKNDIYYYCSIEYRPKEKRFYPKYKNKYISFDNDMEKLKLKRKFNDSYVRASETEEGAKEILDSYLDEIGKTVKTIFIKNKY